MITLDCKQGSEEWLAARVGLPTASSYEKILTPAKLQPSTQAVPYRNQLLAEWIIGHYLGDDQNAYMDRGADMEASARAFYELQSNVEVEQVGFILRADERTGGSPDGLVGDDGILEVKCPSLHVHIGYVLDNDALAAKYKAQVQGYLYLTDRQWAHILSYNPIMPSVLVRVERDEKYIGALGPALDAFCDHLDQCKEVLAGYRRLALV